MEDDAARPKPSVEPSESDRELQARIKKLEDEAASLRGKLVNAPEQKVTESSAEPALAAEASTTETETEPEAVAEPPPPTSEQLARAESLIRQARLAKTRGQTAQATELLKQAEAAAPTAPAVLEYIGDDYFERKQYKNARESFSKALKLTGKNVALENKYALCVLNSSPATNPMLTASYEAVGNAKVAVVFTALLPGLGQIVTGEVGKGVSIVLLWIASAGWALWGLFMQGGMEAIVGGAYRRGSAEFHPILILPIAVAAITYLGALYDSGLNAKTAERRPIIHPKPPDNLPFE